MSTHNDKVSFMIAQISLTKYRLLCSIATNDDLVKSVTVNSGRVPHVLLCSERQLNEIKAFCFDKQCGSVLSFDKTYNLGSLYLPNLPNLPKPSAKH